MFLDEKEVFVKAGKGGDGAALFRREIYVPHGGPDGGDGGDGGDIILRAIHNLHALSHLARTDKINAEDGMIGGHRRSTGKSGIDTIIEVPLGTIVYEIIEGEKKEVIELTDNNQEIKIAKGGNGGWGNWHFRSSIQQAPTRFNPGQPGEEKRLLLVLKLIADVGLIGLPNAGKSTLLSVISRARPKIADYPFTTLEPQLGVAEIPNTEPLRQIVVADLPGLVEGASGGKGLGVTFLKHIERTRELIHCISAELLEEELVPTYKVIRGELEEWSKELAAKPEIVALTKCDLLDEAQIKQRVSLLKKATGREVFPISAAAHKGILDLLTNTGKVLS